MEIDIQIKELTKQANDDAGAAQTLADAGYFAHSLFWIHLVLEKYCKALWISKNNSVQYPFTHNLLRLLKECDLELSEHQIKFFVQLNQFQAQGRYPDDLKKIETTVSKELCTEIILESKLQIKWIEIQLMQKK